jgi:hypothetical protein
LPGSVAEIFEARLSRALPLRAPRVLARIRETRGGRLNDSRFGSRMQGEGSYLAALRQAFEASRRRLGYATFPEPRSSGFRRPVSRGPQLGLFD